ncbi:hypothetical protein ACTMS2_02720 [Micromonospora sp. SD12]|uniref:hypothetical protein n=1 Tax=Micromonospora sp. SD12 TaxID=3452216 RepID=UPI003F888165
MANPYGNQFSIFSDNQIDANGNSPLQLVNAFRADGVDTGVTITTLQAADINADGTPDLWAVLPTYRAYLISGLSSGGTATVTATRARPLA